MKDREILEMTKHYGGGYVPLYCHLMDDDLDTVMDELDREDWYFYQLKREYHDTEWPKVQEHVQALFHDIPEDERRQMRIQSLKDQLETAKAQNDQRRGRKILNALRVLNGRADTVTHEQIEQARNYPITKLVTSRNYQATCPFHPDTSPSLNIRNNFYYCHGCGAHGDTIDLLMQRDGLSFKEAVTHLAYEH